MWAAHTQVFGIKRFLQDPCGYGNSANFPTLLAGFLLCFQAESPMEQNILIFFFVFTRGVLSVKWLPV